MLSEEEGYEAPYYVIFSTLLLQLLSQIQIFFSALRFKISSAYSSLLNLLHSLLSLRNCSHTGRDYDIGAPPKWSGREIQESFSGEF
jgi:hypothetical protein